ncbi:hypothetical protein Noc_0763 [Nitrosococcus oceani ATCC 19707]|uniref:Uncharacterized protein n=2 Tax=Nitrosococcus oceani TaxID=1229 RepID=Q3JD20_NITOC|nr:hypothetical protein Noc_0763 [Nitrosococcus oceani ATCC 19707]EDZ65932.1 hypothetical protein NOC27_2612 [Nitrosococcus oceani AFC27]KFI20252.1 hypothetical protein IB75_03845 [Nitrosococcus oceani C-27]
MIKGKTTITEGAFKFLQVLFYWTGGFSRSSRNTGLTLFFLTWVIAGLGGCSSPPPEEVVGQRAVERWQALAQRDMEKAYSYLSPGYRAVNSLELYQARIGDKVQWKGATVKKIACADNTCDVTLTLRYRYATPPTGSHYEGERPIKEKWTQTEDQWWLLPED